MMNINKAHFDLDGDNVRLTMPIAKVDEERRIVSGFATLDNIDRQGDVLLSDASRKAFENFRGNVRLMHQPIPAGKVVSFRENSFYDQESGKTYTGIFVDAYISKGAENIWQMVLDGTLTGFSIGGRILNFENKVLDNGSETPVRVVDDYELMELSLVDSPANQFANIFSIQKLGDEIVTSGMATEFSTENVFWCQKDKIAVTEKSENFDCPSCQSPMSEIGWVESNDLKKNDEVSKIVDNYLLKSKPTEEVEKETVTSTNTPNKNPQQGLPGRIPKEKKKKKITFKTVDGPIAIGDYVAWSESDNVVKGRVVELRTSGVIKSLITEKQITASEEDPVAIINIYEKNSDGKYSSTNSKIAKACSRLKKILVSEVSKRLEELVSQHNEKHGNVTFKRLSKNILQKVYDRGVEAYENNPISDVSDLISKEQWALARVEGFLYAAKTGKFKRVSYDKDLLPDGHPLAITKKQEGGVEVANNETSHEELDTAQATDEAVETVEFEVEETIEGVVTEALAMAKSDNVEAEIDQDTSSEVFDMEKALGEVKSFVEEAVTKSVESSTESLNSISNAVLELAKAVDDKIGQLQSKYEEVTKSLADLNNAATEIAGRVESVEEETAIKKSGELENSIPEQPVMKKSLWGGRFLSSADIFN